MIRLKGFEDKRKQNEETLLSTTSTGNVYQYIDMHMHYLGFIQQTQGFQSLVNAMDAQNVEKAVLFCMPYNIEVSDKSIHYPGLELNYYLTDDSHAFWYGLSDIFLLKDYKKWLAGGNADRFYLFLGGVNTVNEKSAEQMERIFHTWPNVFWGIGELMFRHDFLTWKSGGVTPRVDSQAAKNIFSMAANHGLPCIIHQDLTSIRSNGEPFYQEELETALSDNPNTKIIWAHCGMTYNISVPNLTTILRGMLTRHPNLFIDLSWVVYDNCILGNEAEWADLLDDYPTRFMIGTDTVAKWFDGTTVTYNIQKYSVVLDYCTNPVTRQNVAKDNFTRLLPTAPVS